MVGILRDTNYTTPVFTQVLSVWKKSDTFIVVGAVQLLATSRISDCGFYEFVFDYHQLVQLPEKKKKTGCWDLHSASLSSPTPTGHFHCVKHGDNYMATDAGFAYAASQKI